ncbi:Uncharacterised protein [Bordetella avium]|nr:Uncharacterised protein [Bordetella avium]
MAQMHKDVGPSAIPLAACGPEVGLRRSDGFVG